MPVEAIYTARCCRQPWCPDAIAGNPKGNGGGKHAE